MTFYVQHGYGKGDKIETLATRTEVSGVILSPKDENAASLDATARSARLSGLGLMVDPQTYMYSTEPPGSGRCHAMNGLPTRRVSWAQDAKDVTGLVESVGALNARLNASAWISPTPLQTLFVDEMTSLSLQYARTAASAWAGQEVYASLVVDQSAFANWEMIERWLTEATTLNVTGFYLVVAKTRSTYPAAAWDTIQLANYFRLVYVLTEISGYELVLGYSDYEGPLGIASGATAMASGWSYSLRQLSPERWKVAQAFGAQPVPRLNLKRLWTPIRAQADAEPIFTSTYASEAFAASELADFTANGFEFDRPTAQTRHLIAMAERVDELSSLNSIGDRLDLATHQLTEASSTIRKLNDKGFLTGEPYLGRVDALKNALIAFRSAEGA
jgi:hypothetical protein